MVRERADEDRPRERRPRRTALAERPDGGSAARRIAWALVGAVAFVAAKLALGF